MISRTPSLGIHLIALACASATWIGCRSDEGSLGAPAFDRIQITKTRIYGDDTTRDNNAGGDSFTQDIVVQVFGTGICTGTLITPSIVLTAAHCTASPNVAVFVGPQSGGWKSQTTGTSVAMQDPSIADSNADIALVYLDKPVMEVADSMRPLAWSGWLNDGLIFPVDWERFGIAGWSLYSGPWECDSGEPGPADAEHQAWRQSAEGRSMFSFGKLPGENTITWFTVNHNKANKGDSGGPLYLQVGGRRQVIGVLSKKVCHWDIGQYIRSNLYTNVTDGTTAAWIEEHARENDRTANWMARHGVSTPTHWKGEVDYTGPCNIDADSDCDHWWNWHDDCPFDYNPGQEEDASGKGIACRNRVILDFDPNNPRPVREKAPLGNCTTDSAECPIGICYFSEVSGQFWQSSPQGSRIEDSDFIGSWARIAIENGQYVRDSGINFEMPNGEFFMPPMFKWGCTSLRDIKSIPDPTQCTVATNVIGFGNPYPLNASSVLLTTQNDSFNVLSGLIGSIGFPGHDNHDRPAQVYVTNTGTAGVSTFLKHRRDTTAESHAFTAEAFSVSCPGWTNKFAASSQVFAFSVPTTYTLVASNPDPDVHPRAEESACFLTGFGGPWGGWSQSTRTPTARIYKDPHSGDILMTVTPSGIPGTDQVVEARATCLDLSP